MATPYKAPLRDMQFVMHEVFWKVEKHYKAMPCHAEIDRDTGQQRAGKAGAQFAEGDVLSPINRSAATKKAAPGPGDGAVTTPKGFKEAYAKYVSWALARCRRLWSTAVRDCRLVAGHRHERNDEHGQLVVVHVPRSVARRCEHRRSARHRRAEETYLTKLVSANGPAPCA
jgi:hypothetical protein